MHKHMRTTIDIPDHLLSRFRARNAKSKTTLRAFVIASLEKELAAPSAKFTLRDASVGSKKSARVSNDSINRALDAMRDFGFRA